MAADPRLSLLGAARTHWKYFALAWAWPVFLYLGGALGLVNQATFGLVLLPLFFLGFFRAQLPHHRKQVGYWPTVFWSMLVPFFVWAFIVFGVGLATQALAEA
jgi:hypothetical protein